MSGDGNDSQARGRLALRWTLAAPLAAVLGVPFVFRPSRRSHDSLATESERPADLPEKKLTLISPHWEGVRTEFGRAFSASCSKTHPARFLSSNWPCALLSGA